VARTTRIKVVEILVGHYDGTTDLDPFIDTANELITWLDGEDTDGDLTTAMLEKIERYLAAHFYAHADQLMQSKSTGGASGAFQGQTGMGLAHTHYGYTAMVLDVTGKLAQRNKETEEGGKRKASVAWLGLPVSEQTDYVDRD